ncbi:hypothetical protein [Leisingera sp. JC1]|uniref:hypothetical protein n=1 Tax=Leisingera sp. JC1 TaxID=1855282 RepID=UPI00080317B3|nr:hypothetical protein [Leisingera sp. JC1]OBY25608.1 hypothetical protein A9D60_21475 [Leisingera sp. JC1]
MLKSAVKIAALTSLYATSGYPQSFEWTELGGELDLAIVSSTSGGQDFGQSGFAVNQIGLKLKLRTSIDIIREKHPDLSQDFFTIDDDGSRISVNPTIANVWSILSRDSTVLGIVPVGYSETAGSPDIAGYYRIDGVSFNSVFSAPNMDTVLCLDDLNRDNANKQNFNVPFLFEANVGPRYTYTYDEEKTPVQLDYLDTENRWGETFAACQDMIQTGFRLIQPQHIMVQNRNATRAIEELPLDLSIKSFPLTAMMFDRNARFSFVRFGNIGPISAAEILSSDAFQQSDCIRSLRGAKNCEIWATMLTAFDDAAMVIRSGPEDDPTFFGDPQVISPAVLVLSMRPLPLSVEDTNNQEQTVAD